MSGTGLKIIVVICKFSICGPDWEKDILSISMRIESSNKMVILNQPTHGLCLWLRERCSTTVGIVALTKACSGCSPAIRIVSVEVNAIRTTRIQSSVFTPHPTSIWIGGLVVNITIRIDARHKIKLHMIYDVLNFRIHLIIIEEIPHKKHSLHQTHWLSGMMYGRIQNLWFTCFILARIIRNFHMINWAILKS